MLLILVRCWWSNHANQALTSNCTPIAICLLFSDMKCLEQGYEERVKAYKTAAANAGAEYSSSEYALTKEREAHLAVVRFELSLTVLVSCTYTLEPPST